MVTTHESYAETYRRSIEDPEGFWMEQAGLRTWQDAAGNQCGRREGRTPGLPALMLGSHLDTVPDAGSYDGMLGVLLAIATGAAQVAAELAGSGTCRAVRIASGPAPGAKVIG